MCIVNIISGIKSTVCLVLVTMTTDTNIQSAYSADFDKVSSIVKYYKLFW